MFHLHTSNRTEKLSERLAAILGGDEAPSLFRPELFLIQSRGMERMLSQYLADVFGVWGHATYLLPVQFITSLGERLGLESASRAFDRDILTWRLERILRDVTDADLKPLTAYLTEGQGAVKRFQLARRLADLFDQYQIMRPDYLDAWQRGRLVSAEPSERWQRRLWLRLREDAPGIPHRGEILRQLSEALVSGAVEENRLPRRLFVFGLHTMPPLFLLTLRALAGASDVHLFLPSPCRLYWGDIETRKARARRRLQQSAHGEEPAFDEPLFHPLLASLGRQGSDFQELLLTDVEEYDEGPDAFVSPLDDGPPTLLRLLQADILDGREEPPAGSAPGVAPDDSLLVVSCHSRMREIEVLKDHILSWLYRDPDLQLHQIVVMAPNIQDYAQLIPALFDDIQHTIADRQARRKNPYFDTFLQFLDLFSGRFGWSELLALLEKPEVHPRFDLSAGDLELVHHWVVASGIRWGLSAEQRRRDGLYAFEPGSWRAGLERMLMGFAIDADEPVDTILPFTDIEGSQGDPLGGLCAFVALIERMGEEFKAERTLGQWSALLTSCCQALFVDNERPDLLALSRAITELDTVCAGFHSEPVGFEVIKAWLEAFAETKSSAGFLSGSLTFCSMLPMRSIPFRIICLLGLNDGVFPQNDPVAAFDLLGLQYRHGDRSRRADDRYQFLEAMMAARERLYLSYVGQSIKSNKSMPPSVVITELLETLDRYYGAADLTVEHPLHGTSRRYFEGGERVFSYDAYNCRVAGALQNAATPSPVAWLAAPLPAATERRLELAELARFLGQPQAYFVREVMGILPAGIGDDPDEHELFGLDGLGQYAADQLVVAALLEGQDQHRILARLQAEQRWPLGAPGRLRFEGRIGALSRFAESVAALMAGSRREEFPVRLVVGDFSLDGSVPNLYASGLLFYRYADLKGKDLLRAWLFHLVANLVLDTRVDTHLLARDASLTLAAGAGGAADLARLLDYFGAGRQRPSPLFVEPALAYARQVVSNRGRGRTAPIDRARKEYETGLEQNFEPEWRLLYRDLPSAAVLDDEFERICVDFMLPLFELAGGALQEGPA